MKDRHDYLIEKRIEVLEAIKPYCELFGITRFDYFVNTESGGEVLKLNDTYIGCRGNSNSAIVDEVVGYIFVNLYCKHRYIGAFRTQTLNVIRQYWIDRPSWIVHPTVKGGAEE